MIVTIDGPAGAGKSSAAKALADRLGFRFLDTGAMYRAVTLAAIEQGTDLQDSSALVRIAGEIDLKLDGRSVWLGQRDVTSDIRTFEITTNTHYAADCPEVRAQLVEWQRRLADRHDVVTEGRDQATVVFPHAECQIFLTASEEVRSERRYLDLIGRDEQVTREEVLAKQQERDERDRSRAVGPLLKSDEAIEVSTDGLSPQEVVDRLLQIVESCRASL